MIYRKLTEKARSLQSWNTKHKEIAICLVPHAKMRETDSKKYLIEIQASNFQEYIVFFNPAGASKTSEDKSKPREAL